MIFYATQISVSVNKRIETQPCSFIYTSITNVCFSAAEWVVVTEGMAHKPKILTIWSFAETNC